MLCCSQQCAVLLRYLPSMNCQESIYGHVVVGSVASWPDFWQCFLSAHIKVIRTGVSTVDLS